jgi:putative methyltransferase
MKHVFFNEYNILMGNTTHIPLVSGLLRAFSETIPIIKEKYQFMPFLFHKADPDVILANYHNPSIAAFSVSMWNEQLNLKVAKKVKKNWPNCLVVFGGPQVPHLPAEYFKKYDFIDVTVRGEGEEPFSAILEQNLNSGEFYDIPSISWRHPKTKQFVHNDTEQPFKRDLDYYPSPYIEGLFDEMIRANSHINFQAIVETNRGCPFLCTFCYWGKGGLSRKYRYHGLERTFKELLWCAENKIKYVFNADSNFGMHKRDMEIAKELVKLKVNLGYPEKFRTCYGKNTDQRIFEIGTLFHNYELEKGITLSRQSLNNNTLKLIKRDNIKLTVYSNLQRNFNESNVPVYCEMILGLPGETFSSWINGIETLLTTGIKNQIFIFLCQVYPNTELADKQYRLKHGIITRFIEMNVIHADVNKPSMVKELEETIVGTSTLNTIDWKRAARFSYITMLLHSMKIGFYVMGYLKDHYSLPYIDFIKFISDREFKFNELSILNDVLDKADSLLNGILDGKGRGSYNRNYGEIYWEFEEMAFLLISTHLEEFYSQFEILVKEYLDFHVIDYNSCEVREAVLYQQLLIPDCNGNIKNQANFLFNFPEYFEKRLSNWPVKLRERSQSLTVVQPDFKGDKKTFARMVILWGRKSGLIERQASWVDVEQVKISG